MDFGVAFRDGLVLKHSLYFRPTEQRASLASLLVLPSSKFGEELQILSQLDETAISVDFPSPVSGQNWHLNWIPEFLWCGAPNILYTRSAHIAVLYLRKYLLNDSIFLPGKGKLLPKVTPTHFVASWNRNSSAAVDGDWPKTSNKSPWVVRLAPGWQKLAAFRRRQKWPWKARIY